MTQTQSPIVGTLAAFLMAVITGCTNMPAAPTLTAAAKAELAPTGALRVAVFTGNPVIGAKDKAFHRLHEKTRFRFETWKQRAVASSAREKEWWPQLPAMEKCLCKKCEH